MNKNFIMCDIEKCPRFKKQFDANCKECSYNFSESNHVQSKIKFLKENKNFPFRRVRMYAGVQQFVIAEILGVSQATISRLEQIEVLDVKQQHLLNSLIITIMVV